MLVLDKTHAQLDELSLPSTIEFGTLASAT